MNRKRGKDKQKEKNPENWSFKTKRFLIYLYGDVGFERSRSTGKSRSRCRSHGSSNKPSFLHDLWRDKESKFEIYQRWIGDLKRCGGEEKGKEKKEGGVKSRFELVKSSWRGREKKGRYISNMVVVVMESGRKLKWRLYKNWMLENCWISLFGQSLLNHPYSNLDKPLPPTHIHMWNYYYTLSNLFYLLLMYTLKRWIEWWSLFKFGQTITPEITIIPFQLFCIFSHCSFKRWIEWWFLFKFGQIIFTYMKLLLYPSNSLYLFVLLV